jgi:hypothetical protein
VPTTSTNAGAPAVSAAASGAFWAGAAKKMGTSLEPGQYEARVFWYTPSVNYISADEKELIQKAACDIAFEKGCDVIAIRSNIHNTTNTRTRDQWGRKLLAFAPWHFTVEFQHKNSKRWWSAHVYTETTEFRNEHGDYIKSHRGLKAVDRDVPVNPEIWTANGPHHSPNLYQSKYVILG